MLRDRLNEGRIWVRVSEMGDIGYLEHDPEELDTTRLRVAPSLHTNRVFNRFMVGKSMVDQSINRCRSLFHA